VNLTGSIVFNVDLIGLYIRRTTVNDRNPTDADESRSEATIVNTARWDGNQERDIPSLVLLSPSGGGLTIGFQIKWEGS
jgi:hypothetical protein